MKLFNILFFTKNFFCSTYKHCFHILSFYFWNSPINYNTIIFSRMSFYHFLYEIIMSMTSRIKFIMNYIVKFNTISYINKIPI